MRAYNEVANYKHSRYFELVFKEYYELQNDIKLVDLNETNSYAMYDFRDEVNKYFIEIRHRKEDNRDDLTYVLFNRDKLERLYELQEQNKKYKIMNYQYVYNDEDGLENHKIYSINLLDFVGRCPKVCPTCEGVNLATCIDNQGKTCYKIPMIYYNKMKDYAPRVPEKL
jgi:hypothetical protein